jgi:hypothetical protein
LAKISASSAFINEKGLSVLSLKLQGIAVSTASTWPQISCIRGLPTSAPPLPPQNPAKSKAAAATVSKLRWPTHLETRQPMIEAFAARCGIFGNIRYRRIITIEQAAEGGRDIGQGIAWIGFIFAHK